MAGTGTTYKSHAKTYWYVFALLAILTIAELIAAEAGWSYAMKASSLTLLAFGKAFAVAYWYMHLNEETAWLKFIAAIPISAGVYATVVILETVFR